MVRNSYGSGSQTVERLSRLTGKTAAEFGKAKCRLSKSYVAGPICSNGATYTTATYSSVHKMPRNFAQESSLDLLDFEKD